MLRVFAGFRSGLAHGSDLLKHKFYETEEKKKRKMKVFFKI